MIAELLKWCLGAGKSRQPFVAKENVRRDRRRGAGGPKNRRRLLEELECRTLLSAFTVNSLADPVTLTAHTLRWAVLQANTTPGSNTITFSGLTGTITLTQGFMVLSGANTTITGPGAGILAVSGNQMSGVFQITSGSTASITGLTLTDGLATSQGGGIFNSGILSLTACTLSNNTASNGGAIDNQATLTIANCTFSGNSAQANGGGINSSGNLTVTGSAFTANSAQADGAGIYCAGTSAVTTSTFTNNSASSGAALNEGGAIFNKGSLTIGAAAFTGNSADQGGGVFNNGLNSTNLLTVTNTTFSANIASIAGGGLSNVLGTIDISNSTFAGNSNTFAGPLLQPDDGAGGGLDNQGAGVLTNCTFFNNQAPLLGGAIDNENSVGTTLTVNDCTISGNTAPSGAGIFLVNSATLNNTIVAGNTGGDVAGANTTTLAAASSFNLIGDGSGGLVNGTGGAAGNLLGIVAAPINAKLGPLAGNGGLTQTMVPHVGSPTLNAGGNSLIPTGITTDQRGYARIVNTTVDIGAVEVQPPNTPTNTSPADSAIAVSLTPTLQAGAFTDPDGETQTAAQWIVSHAIGGGSNAIQLVFDSGTDAIHLTSITVPSADLLNSTNYSWQVRYQNSGGLWSAYSAATSFTTAAPATVPLTATLTASKLNILLGAAETLSAAVPANSGPPNGSVTFYDGATALNTVSLVNGNASYSTTTLAFGVHSLTFTYTDNNALIASSPPVDVFVGSTKNQVIVNALYRQLLNRDAEETQTGLYYWSGRLDKGTPLSSVADGIASSVEYDDDVVAGIYQQYLNRAPDATGQAGWVGQMQAGAVSYETIRGYILGSQELHDDAVAKYGDYVTGLYQILLGRAPDAAGLAYWNQILGAGDTDALRDRVSIGISTSFEQYENFITAKFQQFLNRLPTPALPPSLPTAADVTVSNPTGVPFPTTIALQGELGYWADRLNHGTTDGDFIADLLSSNEYLTDQGLA